LQRQKISDSCLPGPPTRAGKALVELLRHPRAHLLARWNWKSALLSSLIRASIFFATNLTAGLDEAFGAMLAEFVFRASTAGFYGAVTQAFRRVEPAWHGAVIVMVLLPVCTHSLEFIIHWLRGTPKLFVSILVSACFTALSTLFNWYAMRRGALVVGAEGDTLASDMRRMPSILLDFVLFFPRTLLRVVRTFVRSRFLDTTGA